MPTHRRFRKAGALTGAIIGSVPFLDIAFRILNDARSSGEPHIVFWVIVELASSFLVGAIPIAIGAILGGVIGNMIDLRRAARAAVASETGADPGDVAP